MWDRKKTSFSVIPAQAGIYATHKNPLLTGSFVALRMTTPVYWKDRDLLPLQLERVGVRSFFLERARRVLVAGDSDLSLGGV
jgi:hypothetical protein